VRRLFPEAVVRTHQGRAALFYEDLVRGRIVTINFMYLGCSEACPLTTVQLAGAQRHLGARLGRDVFFYSLTLDPYADSVAALADHARALGAGPGWLFLRAEPQDTERLRRRLGFFDRDPELDAQRSTHAAMIRYGNEPRRWWGTLGADADAQTIARAIARVSGPPPAG
jgi:protein SCO1/2